MYPFGDNASLVAADETAEFFSTTFIDASIYPIGSVAGVRLTKIIVGTGRTATVYIGDEDTDELASGTVDIVAPGSEVILKDTNQRPAGVLVSAPNKLAIFQSWSPGTYLFSKATFTASVVIPVPAIGVRGFLVGDSESPELFYGDAWIVGENGAVVRKDGTAIRVDFVGDPLFRRRLCDDAGSFLTPTFLKTINGVKGDAEGNFSLTVAAISADDTVLRVTPNDNGCTISAVGQQLE
jgi:hypothetical protein